MSITITPEDVQKIARLARLTLSEKEIATATSDLSRILDHFSALQSLDTRTVAETTDVTGQTNSARDDVAQPDHLGRAVDLLRQAPAVDDAYIKVPAVF